VAGAWCTELAASITEFAAQGWKPARAPGPSGHITQDWPLATLEAALTIAGGYLAFVFLGMLLMPLLPAVSDKVFYPLKFVYNVMQIFLCGYMTVESGILAYRNGYSLFPLYKLAPFDAVSPPVANLLWLFYISKCMDFFDTFTIVCQKKWSQLSFLHVYHHASVFLFYWLNLRVGYDGDIFLTIMLNAGIHTVMYTYYFLAMHTKDIWWKRYLTMMQMVQFCLMLTQAAMMMWHLNVNNDASFPPRMTQGYFVYICSMLFLFAQFYKQSYTKKGKGKEGKETDVAAKKAA